ncbi:MAG: hypothetical protein J0L60_03850 [Ignavibacteria bacterium]|nr:hypothetical protein [Ignavibacteria bacterium]
MLTKILNSVLFIYDKIDVVSLIYSIITKTWATTTHVLGIFEFSSTFKDGSVELSLSGTLVDEIAAVYFYINGKDFMM